MAALDTSINIGNIISVIVAAGSVIVGLFKVLRKQDDHGAQIGDVKGDVGALSNKVEAVSANVHELRVGQAVTNAGLDAVKGDVAGLKGQVRELEKAK